MPSGRVFEGRDIPAGAERRLASAAADRTRLRKAAHVSPRVRSPVPTGSVYFSSLDRAAGPRQMLSPGSYVAFLE